MTITVREITPHEWERFRQIRLRALADAPYAFSSTVEDEQERPESSWRARLEDPERATFAAIADDRWIGLAGVFADPDDPRAAHLVSMWVDPTARRHGIGKLLVDTIAKWARQRGFERLDLWVTETNEPAIRLYTSCGFRSGADRQPLPSHPHLIERVMHLDLREAGSRPP